MIRTPYASERIQMIDPETGIKVIQLTSYPIPSTHFKYVWPSITPDNRILLFCQRSGRRNAPWDMFRCDADGLNLFQLTERTDSMERGGYYGRPPNAMKLDGSSVYTVWDKLLCEVDVETGNVTELLSLADSCPKESVISEIFILSTGKRLYITYAIIGTGKSDTLRVDLETGAIEEVDLGGPLAYISTGEPRLIVKRGHVLSGVKVTKDGSRVCADLENERAFWSVDEDGNDAQMISPELYAHATVLGSGTDMQGPGLPPHRCIWIGSVGKEPRKLVEGPYFWHSGASLDGEWIVSDTNWPDEGLQLIHVETGHMRTLCHPHASCDHIEYGHPHPLLSQDGRIAVFRSDRTNVSQVYAAIITDEFRESVIAGELDNPKDKWI